MSNASVNINTIVASTMDRLNKLSFLLVSVDPVGWDRILRLYLDKEDWTSLPMNEIDQNSATHIVFLKFK